METDVCLAAPHWRAFLVRAAPEPQDRWCALGGERFLAQPIADLQVTPRVAHFMLGPATRWRPAPWVRRHGYSALWLQASDDDSPFNEAGDLLADARVWRVHGDVVLARPRPRQK